LIEAAYYRAQCNYQLGKFSAALQDVDLFLKSRPSFEPALFLMAKIYFRQGDDSPALSCVEQLISLKQTTIEISHRLARARLLKELALSFDFSTQQRVLRLALHEFESTASEATPSEVLIVKDLLGGTEEVLQKYNALLENNPRDIQTRLQRGWTYANTGRYDSAAEDFLTVIQQHSTDAAAYSGLGYVRALKGLRDAAEIEAMNATLRGANRYEVIHNVACIYGELAEGSTTDFERRRCEELALTLLWRAISLYQLKAGAIDEFEQIRIDPAFHANLRARPEFQQLLKK
jgi:tetratricopeptide (TPR) repeat protein